MPLSLTERFPRAKSSWLETLRHETQVSADDQTVAFTARRRKHGAKSRLSGIVF